LAVEYEIGRVAHVGALSEGDCALGDANGHECLPQGCIVDVPAEVTRFPAGQLRVPVDDLLSGKELGQTANVAELDSSIRTIAFERNNAALLVGFNNGVAAVLRFSEIVS